MGMGVTPEIPPGRPLRVLLVEDNEDDAYFLLRELQRGGYTVSCERVDTAEAMRAALAQQSWEVVVADYVMPHFSGLAALTELQASGQDLPFIVVSGTIGEDIAVAAMKAGAHDYLMKGKLARLAPAIDRELREAEARRQRRQARQELRASEAKYKSLTDEMPVGLYRTLAEGRVLHANPAFATMLGFASVKEVLDTCCMDDLYADPLERRRQVASWRPGGEPAAQEVQLHTRDGRQIWVRDTGRVIFDPDSQLTYMDGMMEDITARKQAEEQLQRQLQRLAALRAIDMAITTSFDLHVTLSLLLDQGLPQLDANAAAILQFNPHLQVLEYVAGRGFRNTAVNRARLRLGEGPAGRAALERRNVHVPRLADEMASFARRFGGEMFTSYYALPITSKGNLKGLLEIFHHAPFAPDTDWIDFAETLAGQAAIAMDNVSLFEGLERSNIELAVAYDTTLEGWSRALDLRDKETEGHSERVTDLTLRLGRALGLDEAELAHMRRGALLHDIGKMGIPDSILLKAGPLTPEEWEIMRLHPAYAYELLSPIAFLRPALDIPHCHHEKWDGTGYPRGLKGEQIPLAARIFAVVDVWDALCCDRPYRPAWPHDIVRTHIQGLIGSHFDPKVTVQFLKLEI
jgi:PAS domain S-box-containing protein